MKGRTKKMLLIITIVLAGFTIVAKTILNSEYYNIVKAINKNYEIQNPIDYKDDEPNNEKEESDNTNNLQEVTEDNNEIIDTDVIENNSNETQNNVEQNDNTEETTMPSRPSIEM